MKYNFKKLEKKWQKKWEQGKVFETNIKKKAKKFYLMEMFPYPSALGLHLGHALNYTIGDILARFKRMKGFSVLYPMGFDSLGLPAENAAIKAGTHPKPYTKKAIKNYIKQMKDLGLSYDWSKLVSSMEPEYYKWNQLFFLKFLEKGLAYRKRSAVNWCPECNSVLANEQVHNGKCWRHEGTEVEIEHLEQWFLKTTDYADELLEGIDDLQWPQKIKTMQKNWIGKSYGTEIDFATETGNKIDKVVLMHGKNTNPNEKWYPWFAKEIKKRGIEFVAPKLSNAEDPEINLWMNELDKTNPDESTILVGHSQGGVAILRWLEKLPKEKKIKKVILVATNSGSSKKMDKTENNKGFFNNKGYNFEKIKSHCHNFIVIHSKNDHIVPFSAGEENAKGLNAKFKIYEDKFHFGKCLDKVPEVLKEISSNKKFPVFTTRPDTIYGVTFMVVSAQHEKLMELVTKEQKKDVEKFLHKIKSVSEKDAVDLEKQGVFTGSYAINPINGNKVPVYAGNFVVAEYGSGMVMGVPAHDQRDFDFAKKYGLEIREVIKSKEVKNPFGVEAIIETKDGTFLFQGRDENTKISQKKIGVFGGGVKKGETSLEAIKRELREELNLSLTDKQIEFISAVPSPHKKGGYHNLFYVKGIDRDKLTLDEGEFILESKLNNFLKNKKASPFAKIAINYFVSKQDKAYLSLGILINSEKFNGLDNEKAKQEITKYLTQKKLGRKSVQFKMRDWLISRQRYWGTPIPVVYCDKCGIVAVDEKDLPVILPEKVVFGKGNPLATNKKFVNVKCPKCNAKARRETDTMDTFVDSSWYFMRYPDNKNSKEPFDKKIEADWLPVDQYIGGIEHATMHLLYARFWTKALRDLGYVNYDEPFTKLFNQGMLHAEDGRKMSKSLGNVIAPEEVSKKYGIDTARFFLMSLAAPDKSRDWSDKGVQGSLKFINKVMDYFSKIKIGKSNPKIESKLNKIIKEVTWQIENFKYNLAVIKIRDLFNSLGEEESKDVLEKSLKLLHPFCPHITEELWSKIGNKSFISLEKWPVADEKKINEKFEKQEQAVEKLKSDIEKIKKLINNRNPKVYVYVLPNELELYSEIKDIEIFAVNDKEKYDPENKSKKVKPGRPGIYLK